MTSYQAMGGYNPYTPSYQDYANKYTQMYTDTNSASMQNNNTRLYNHHPLNFEESSENKKNRRVAYWALGSLAVVLAVGSMFVSSKGKGSDIFSKLKNAGQKCWDRIKKVFSSKKASGKSDEVVLDTVEMIQKNGKATFRLPEKTQTLIGQTQKVMDAAADLNLENVSRNLTDKTSKIKTSRMIIDDNGVEKLITLGKSGKIYCKGPDGKLNLTDQSEEFQKLVQDTVKSIKDKKLNEISSKVKLENVVYDSKITSGSNGTYFFESVNGKGAGTESVRRIITDRFDINSSAVGEAMYDNKNFAKAVAEANPTRKHWYSLPQTPDYSRWKVRSATHTPTIKNWPENAQIMIENNEIIGVIENGKFVSEEMYKNLKQRFPEAFEDVLDKKLDSVIRYLA